MIAAIIQARTGSTRLPKKVFAKIEQKPMLWHVIERAKHVENADQIIVATTNLPEDKQIIEVAKNCGVKSFAGSENDVLDRYYKTAKNFGANIIVRITGDCPFIDPKIIDKAINCFKKNNIDYLSVGHIAFSERASKYPDGLDTEIFKFSALEKAWKEAKHLSEREHVTPYIWKNPDLFKIKTIDNDKNYSAMRWTVDEKKDLEFVREIYKRLYSIKKIFLMQDILDLLGKDSSLTKINQKITRDEGYFKSLKFVNLRGLKIPIYDKIENFGFVWFEKTAGLIDKIKSQDKEWKKVKILAKDKGYIDFLKNITGASQKEIVKYFNDFCKDKNFKKIFSENLKILENTPGNWGDVRFHSLSLYAIVRAKKPEIVVETGVASGKSSALILLALEHNKKGKLFSIDLPNKKGNILKDGAKTSTANFETGWLVPKYLKKRWDLKLGDSLKILPELVKKIDKIDIFLHDSLHTYLHVKKELSIVDKKIDKNGIVLCDNIDLGAGKAFNEFLKNKKLFGFAYRDFGGAKMS